MYICVATINAGKNSSAEVLLAAFDSNGLMLYAIESGPSKAEMQIVARHCVKFRPKNASMINHRLRYTVHT